MVWSLAKERLIPARFAKTNFRGVPVWAVLFSMAGSLLALLSSVLAASTVSFGVGRSIRFGDAGGVVLRVRVPYPFPA